MLKLRFGDFILFVCGVILIFASGFKPIGLDRDSYNYVNMIQSGFNLEDLYLREPGFNLIQLINNIIFSGTVTSFFLMFAIMGVTLKLVAIKKASAYPLLSLLFYIFFYYILHDLTQIRVGVASALFLLAINDKVNNRRKQAVMKLLAAMCFHYSAIIGFLLLILNKDKLNKLFYLFLPMAGVLLALLITTDNLAMFVNYLPNIFAQKINAYINLQDSEALNKINVFNFYYSSLIIIYSFFIIISGNMKNEDVLYLKFMGFGLFSFYALSFLPVMAFRISEFYCIVIVILFANGSRYFKQPFIYQILMIVFGLIYFVTQGLMQNLKF